MSVKKIVSFFLLVFVLASVGTIVAKEKGIIPIEQANTAFTTATAQPTETQKQIAPQTSEKVVAYYFHGNFRCATCRKIEALTTEAIQTGFAEDIKNGRVELKVVNVEEPGNEHYVQDFQLASRSVVVARYERESQMDWKRLDAVWQLVGDKSAFIQMVQDETNALLKAKN